MRHPGYPQDFVQAVFADAVASGARVYGIAGLQGTGKSTLSAQVAALAANQGRHVAVLSIDDFYLDHDQRRQLARDVHPLLATRGPPGTHDLALAGDTVDALRNGRAAHLPRFDKIDDRQLPRAAWPLCAQADLVILEGWFLKTPPQPPAALVAPVNALERDEDPDGDWRHYCNAALASDYPPLWRQIDRLLFLQGPGFEVVPDWRWQQEQTLQASEPARRAMTRAQVERFVQFFERVSRQALATLPGIAERSVLLDAARVPATSPPRS
ncbi:MAG: kinase [Pseudomonadota bacterium]|nr:kinase [Pseudomonadota bacterium]